MPTIELAGGTMKPAYTPLISVVIPCYNAERWISTSITSALTQTYPNREVIVVDDGSTDRSVEIIRGFGDQIRFEAHGRSGGGAVRNRLTDMARGEWIEYLDADDYLLPGKLEANVALLQEHAGVDAIYSSYIVVHTDGKLCDEIVSGQSDDVIKDYICWASFNTTAMLFRRQAVVDLGGWKKDQPCCQEHELIQRLLLAGKRFVPSRLAQSVYRVHGSESVSRSDPLRTTMTRSGLTSRLTQCLHSMGGLNSEHKRALFEVRLTMARSTYGKDRKVASELAASAFQYGRWVIPRSDALPLTYQIALHLLGFKLSERLASWRRRTAVI